MEILVECKEYITVNGQECKKADVDRIHKTKFDYNRQFNELFLTCKNSKFEDEFRIDFVNQQLFGTKFHDR